MNSKIFFAAVFAVLATSFAPASAQLETGGIRVCEPACGEQYGEKNVWIATCCQQNGHTSEEAFDTCCASSCSTESPCKYVNLGSSSQDVGFESAAGFESL